MLDSLVARNWYQRWNSIFINLQADWCLIHFSPFTPEILVTLGNQIFFILPATAGNGQQSFRCTFKNTVCDNQSSGLELWDPCRHISLFSQHKQVCHKRWSSTQRRVLSSFFSYLRSRRYHAYCYEHVLTPTSRSQFRGSVWFSPICHLNSLVHHTDRCHLRSFKLVIQFLKQYSIYQTQEPLSAWLSATR